MGLRSADPINLGCSFCGKSRREVAKLIAGRSAHICNECIGLCQDIMQQEGQALVTGEPRPLQPAHRDRNDVYRRLIDALAHIVVTRVPMIVGERGIGLAFEPADRQLEDLRAGLSDHNLDVLDALIKTVSAYSIGNALVQIRRLGCEITFRALDVVPAGVNPERDLEARLDGKDWDEPPTVA